MCSGYPREHDRARPVRHAAAGLAAGEGADLPGQDGAQPEPAGPPGRVRQPGAAHHHQQDDERRDHQAGRSHQDAALNWHPRTQRKIYIQSSNHDDAMRENANDF